MTLFENILPLYNKQKNTWMLGNTKFISPVENDISALTREISYSTLEINFVFPRTHVLFSIYLTYIIKDKFVASRYGVIMHLGNVGRIMRLVRLTPIIMIMPCSFSNRACSKCQGSQIENEP